MTCAAVQELYRSNLVCTLIHILKGVSWSEQHSCTVLGSMCTGNWIFSMDGHTGDLEDFPIANIQDLH